MSVFFVAIVIGGFVFSVGPAAADFTTEVFNAIIKFFTDLLLGFARMCIGLSVAALRIFMEIAAYNGYIDAPPVIVGWYMVRDVANMFFVLALLVIAFGTMLGLEQYEWKKSLVKLVLAAILINFSRLIIGIAIDASHIFTLTFLNAVQATSGGNLINMLKLDKILDITATQANEDLRLDLLVAGITAALFSLISLVAIGAYLIVMAIRVVVLWILIILSPLAFVLSTIPQGKQYADEFWSELMKYIIVAPITVFFLWLAFATLGNGEINNHIGVKDGGTGSEDVSQLLQLKGRQSVSLSEATTWENMSGFLIAVVFLFVGLERVQRVGTAGGSFVSGAMQFGKNALTIASGYAAGRFAVGTAKQGAALAAKGAGWVAYHAPVLDLAGRVQRTKNFAEQQWHSFEGWRNRPGGKTMQEEWRDEKEVEDKYDKAVYYKDGEIGKDGKAHTSDEVKHVIGEVKLDASGKVIMRKEEGRWEAKKYEEDVHYKDGEKDEEGAVHTANDIKHKKGDNVMKDVELGFIQKLAQKRVVKNLASEKKLEKTAKFAEVRRESLKKDVKGIPSGFFTKDDEKIDALDRFEQGKLDTKEARSSAKTKEKGALGQLAEAGTRREQFDASGWFGTGAFGTPKLIRAKSETVAAEVGAHELYAERQAKELERVQAEAKAGIAKKREEKEGTLAATEAAEMGAHVGAEKLTEEKEEAKVEFLRTHEGKELATEQALLAAASKALQDMIKALSARGVEIFQDAEEEAAVFSTAQAALKAGAQTDEQKNADAAVEATKAALEAAEQGFEPVVTEAILKMPVEPELTTAKSAVEDQERGFGGDLDKYKVFAEQFEAAGNDAGKQTEVVNKAKESGLEKVKLLGYTSAKQKLVVEEKKREEKEAAERKRIIGDQLTPKQDALAAAQTKRDNLEENLSLLYQGENDDRLREQLKDQGVADGDIDGQLVALKRQHAAVATQRKAAKYKNTLLAVGEEVAVEEYLEHEGGTLEHAEEAIHAYKDELLQAENIKQSLTGNQERERYAKLLGATYNPQSGQFTAKDRAEGLQSVGAKQLYAAQRVKEVEAKEKEAEARAQKGLAASESVRAMITAIEDAQMGTQMAEEFVKEIKNAHLAKEYEQASVKMNKWLKMGSQQLGKRIQESLRKGSRDSVYIQMLGQTQMAQRQKEAMDIRQKQAVDAASDAFINKPKYGSTTVSTALSDHSESQLKEYRRLDRAKAVQLATDQQAFLNSIKAGGQKLDINQEAKLHAAQLYLNEQQWVDDNALATVNKLRKLQAHQSGKKLITDKDGKVDQEEVKRLEVLARRSHQIGWIKDEDFEVATGRIKKDAKINASFTRRKAADLQLLGMTGGNYDLVQAHHAIEEESKNIGKRIKELQKNEKQRLKALGASEEQTAKALGDIAEKEGKDYWQIAEKVITPGKFGSIKSAHDLEGQYEKYTDFLQDGSKSFMENGYKNGNDRNSRNQDFDEARNVYRAQFEDEAVQKVGIDKRKQKALQVLQAAQVFDLGIRDMDHGLLQGVDAKANAVKFLSNIKRVQDANALNERNLHEIYGLTGEEKGRVTDDGKFARLGGETSKKMLSAQGITSDKEQEESLLKTHILPLLTSMDPAGFALEVQRLWGHTKQQDAVTKGTINIQLTDGEQKTTADLAKFFLEKRVTEDYLKGTSLEGELEAVQDALRKMMTAKFTGAGGEPKGGKGKTKGGGAGDLGAIDPDDDDDEKENP